MAGILREQMAAVERARAAARARLEAVKALPAAFLRQVFPQPAQPLPPGWRWVRLGEVADVEMGQSPPGNSYNANGDGYPLLNGPTEFGAIHPTAVQWTTNPTKFAREGDILFCVRGATTGRKNLADRVYCIGRGLAAIRGRPELSDAWFVWHALDVVAAVLLTKASGSTFYNLPGDELAAASIPLPPLSEQRRIAAILTDQTAAVERARAAAEVELEAVEALPAALLLRAFNGEL
jgi:type I restriction enzyme S subunit